MNIDMSALSLLVENELELHGRSVTVAIIYAARLKKDHGHDTVRLMK